MSSLAEIQNAIVGLAEDEREALSIWLASRTLPPLRPEDEKQLLDSLDRAMHDLDEGKGVPLSEARKLVRTWAGK